MKKIVLSLIIVLVCSVSVMAEEKETTWQEACENIATLAETIMGKRQEGVAMPTMMKIAKDSKLTESIIIDAYDEYAHQFPENQKKAVNVFRDKWYLTCAKELRKK